MTITEILDDLRPDKTITRSALYPHLVALKLKPIGVRQRPQRWPENAVIKLRVRFGLPVRRQRNGHTKPRR